MKVSTGGKELYATSPRAERQKRSDSATDGYSPDERFFITPLWALFFWRLI